MRMRRFVGLLLALVLCLGLTACGGSKEPEFDPKEKFRSEVDSAVHLQCIFAYADVKTAFTDLSDIEVSDDNTYVGKGKVTIKDDYGDTYVGKVTAVYTYDESTQSFSKVSLDIETPRKQ